MRNKHSWGFALLLCALSVGLLLGTTVVAKAAGPVQDQSTNFVLLGSVDTADDGTPTKSRAYSKIAPWPDTEDTFFNTGCYESGITPDMPGCFRVVDVKDPFHPVRIATVEMYDRVKSPLPPVPTDPYWGQSCRNERVDERQVQQPSFFHRMRGLGSPGGPGWTTGPTCWDKGWVTRTHYTAGASGDFQEPDCGPGCGLSKGRFDLLGEFPAPERCSRKTVGVYRDRLLRSEGPVSSRVSLPHRPGPWKEGRRHLLGSERSSSRLLRWPVCLRRRRRGGIS